MSKKYFVEESYLGIDFTKNELEFADYENCMFNDCIFAGTNLSDFAFDECHFLNCDFSNAKILNTAFKNIKFENCKLMGLQFDVCSPFLLEFQFIGCQINLSSFYKLNIKKTVFINCMLHEVDFTETDLTAASFTTCDFSGAMFMYTNLEKADFRTSINYSLDPEQNRIKNAKFSMDAVSGLLDKYNINIE